MTLVFADFTPDVAVSLVIAKGIMQADDFAKEELYQLEISVRTVVVEN